jgi:hypothetical protein
MASAAVSAGSNPFAAILSAACSCGLPVPSTAQPVSTGPLASIKDLVALSRERQQLQQSVSCLEAQQAAPSATATGLQRQLQSRLETANANNDYVVKDQHSLVSR